MTDDHRCAETRGREWEHLVPLVEALIDAGNRLRRPELGIFRPSQGGMMCELSDRIDFDVVRDLPRRAEVSFVEGEDYIWCKHCWAAIFGRSYQDRSRAEWLATQR